MPVRFQLAAQPLTQASMLLRWSELLMPRSRSISACRDSTLPASLASAQSTSNSIVVRATSAPRCQARRCSQSMTSSPNASRCGASGDRLRRRNSARIRASSMWRHGPHHIVVGARVQGLDLRLAVADIGEHQDRHGREGAQIAADFQPIPAGRRRVQHHDLGAMPTKRLDGQIAATDLRRVEIVLRETPPSGRTASGRRR